MLWILSFSYICFYDFSALSVWDYINILTFTYQYTSYPVSYVSHFVTPVLEFYFFILNNIHLNDVNLYNYIYTNSSLNYGFKFVVSLLFLIFIRAGIPRYRYDFLTILGWNRFLWLCLCIFSFLIIFYLNQ